MTWVLLGMLLLCVYQLLMIKYNLCSLRLRYLALSPLPVEINASQRALAWLSNAGITNAYTHDKAEDALRSAAYTVRGHLVGSCYIIILYNDILGGEEAGIDKSRRRLSSNAHYKDVRMPIVRCL